MQPLVMDGLSGQSPGRRDLTFVNEIFAFEFMHRKCCFSSEGLSSVRKTQMSNLWATPWDPASSCSQGTESVEVRGHPPRLTPHRLDSLLVNEHMIDIRTDAHKFRRIPSTGLWEPHVTGGAWPVGSRALDRSCRRSSITNSGAGSRFFETSIKRMRSGSARSSRHLGGGTFLVRRIGASSTRYRQESRYEWPWETRLSEPREHDPESSSPLDVEPQAGDAAGAGRTVFDGPSRPLVVLGGDDAPDEPQTLEQIIELGDDQQLITALWHMSHRRLMRIALSRQVPFDAAEDLVQDVFAMLADQLDRVRSPELLGWLAKMVDYECKRYFSMRKRSRGNQVSAQEHSALNLSHRTRDDPEAGLIRQQDLGAALDVLYSREPVDAYIILATNVDGVPSPVVIEVIARRFGVFLTPGALYERRRRIRTTLATRLTRSRREDFGGGDHD